MEAAVSTIPSDFPRKRGFWKLRPEPSLTSEVSDNPTFEAVHKGGISDNCGVFWSGCPTLWSVARIWKEANDGRRYGDTPSNPLPAHARNLVATEFICVSVCSFTFRFVSQDEIREYISFFEKKTHPSSSLPLPQGVDSFFRWHSQRWYERLPMYLQEEAKRQRVLKALRRAIVLSETGKL